MEQIYCWKCGKSFDFYLSNCPHCKARAYESAEKITKPWKKRLVALFLFSLAFYALIFFMMPSSLKEQYEKGYNKGLADGKDKWYDQAYEAAEYDYEYEIKTADNRGYNDGRSSSPSAYSSSSSINQYSGDIEAILDYIRDNPHEFYLYTEEDLERAYEEGLYDR